MRPRLRLLTLLVGALFVLPVLGAHGDSLVYRQFTPAEIARHAYWFRGQALTPLDEPGVVVGLPALTGKPVYLFADLGDEGSPPRAVVFDPQDGGGGVVYLDTDGDGDLADEEPVTPKDIGRGPRHFGPFAVSLQREGIDAIYHCWVFRQPMGGAAADQWALAPGCATVGQITIEGESFDAWLIDRNVNGRFNDIRLTTGEEGDSLFVDWNRDGRIQLGPPRELTEYAERYWHGGKWYSPRISTDGTQVAFLPPDYEFGTIRTEFDSYRLRLNSRTDAGLIDLDGTETTRAPADTWGISEITVYATDDEGRRWRAIGRAVHTGRWSSPGRRKCGPSSARP